MWAKPTGRTGIRIRGADTQQVVRHAVVRFARWLRTVEEFPVRVPVYLRPEPFLVTRDGRQVSASFFAPFEPNIEPYIRIATGDYPVLRRESGRDDALAAILTSLAHEVIHYRQWVETGELSERGVALRAAAMVRRYSETTRHP